MKKTNYLICILIIVTLCSCGTMTSIQDVKSFDKYATVKINNSMVLSGKIISINDSTLNLFIDGKVQTFDKGDVVEYFKKPNTDLMIKDIVSNTSTTASNTGFIVLMTVVSTIISIISILSI